MNKGVWWGKTLRTVGIVLMGITAVFTIMSGAGTTCVALDAAKFGASMAPLAPYQWLYVIFVLVTVAIGVIGVRATVLLVRRHPGAYGQAILVLMAGIVVGVIHMAVSRGLRGKSMPTDAVVYTTLITLFLFLIFRVPAIWKEVNFSAAQDQDTPRKAAALTLALCGIAFLTAPLWGASTHTFIPGGTNWADAWQPQMNLIGGLLFFGGAGMVIIPAIKNIRLQRDEAQSEPRTF